MNTLNINNNSNESNNQVINNTATAPTPDWLQVGQEFLMGGICGHDRAVCSGIEPYDDPLHLHTIIIRWQSGSDQGRLFLTDGLHSLNHTAGYSVRQ